MALTTTSTSNLPIPQLYSTLSADAREENLVMTNLFDRRYEGEILAHGSGDRTNIPGVSNFATGALTLGVGGTLTLEAGSFAAAVVLIIDTHAYHGFDLENEAELFSQLNLMDKLTGKSGYAVALSVDDTVAGLVDNFSTNAVGTLAAQLIEENFFDAMRMLNDAIAPEGDRYAAVSPLQQSGMMQFETLKNSAYAATIGNLSTNIKYRGYFGHFWGADFYMSGNVEGTNAAGHDNGMWHRESAAVAIIDNMRVESMYEIDTDSHKRAVHVIYGVIVVRNDHGVFMRGA